MFIPTVAECRGVISLCLFGKDPSVPQTADELIALEQSIRVAKLATNILSAFAAVALVRTAYLIAITATSLTLLPCAILLTIMAIAAIRLDLYITIANGMCKVKRNNILVWNDSIPDMKKLSVLVKLYKDVPECKGAIDQVRNDWDAFIKGQAASEFNEDYTPYKEVLACCLYQETFGFEAMGFSEEPLTHQFLDGQMKVPSYARMMLANRSRDFEHFFKTPLGKSPIGRTNKNIEPFKEVTRHLFEDLPHTSLQCEKDLRLKEKCVFSVRELNEMFDTFKCAIELGFWSALSKLREHIKMVIDGYPNAQESFDQFLEFWGKVGLSYTNLSQAEKYFQELLNERLNKLNEALPKEKRTEREDQMKSAGVEVSTSSGGWFPKLF